MIDPTNNLNDLLGTLPSLADLAEVLWKTGSHDVLHVAHRAAAEVIQLVQPDPSPLGDEMSKLDVPLRFSWRRQ